MIDQLTRTKRTCSECNGRGTCRDGKHFFYGVCLMASGFLTFFRWPPIPRMFALLGDMASGAGLPQWTAKAALWCLTAVPTVFGIAFILIWLLRDTCRECSGSGRVEEAFLFDGI